MKRRNPSFCVVLIIVLAIGLLLPSGALRPEASETTVVSLNLAKVGMDPGTIKQFREIIGRPNGIVLVTGPTGSGKTTTLYSALTELNTMEDKLITTEDPVEYQIDGIIQIPIDHEIGVTFAACPRPIPGHCAG